MEIVLAILGTLVLIAGFVIAISQEFPIALLCFFSGVLGLLLIIVATKIENLEEQIKKTTKEGLDSKKQ